MPNTNTPPDQTPSWLLSRALAELETINTAKVAAAGMGAEATAISGARVYLDRLGEYPMPTGRQTGRFIQETVDGWGLDRRISGRALTTEDVLDLVKRLTQDTKSSGASAYPDDAAESSCLHETLEAVTNRCFDCGALPESVSAPPVVDGYQQGIKDAAAIAHLWAASHGCDSHDNDPCCHIRIGATIEQRILGLAATPVDEGEQNQNQGE